MKASDFFTRLCLLCLIVLGSLFAHQIDGSNSSEMSFFLPNGLNFADGPVTLIKKSEIDKLTQEKILASGLELTTHNKDKIRVFTLAEYREAIQGGAFALTTLDMAMERDFILADKILSLLGQALPVQEELPLDWTADLSQLPVSLLPQLGLREGSADGDDVSSFSDYLNKGKLRILKKSETSLRVLHEHTLIVFSEIARADLNHDGSAEILLWVDMKVVGGTMAASDLVVLQRKNVHSIWGAYRDGSL